ncbi:MAG: hypothetical protein AB7E47_02985 [Desulfovibrionaceae bacterium]
MPLYAGDEERRAAQEKELMRRAVHAAEASALRHAARAQRAATLLGELLKDGAVPDRHKGRAGELAQDVEIVSPRALIVAEVLIERSRQEEKYSPEHDDMHDGGELAQAMACYAVGSDLVVLYTDGSHSAPIWPFYERNKVTLYALTDRQRLVRSLALGLAELERMDRATLRLEAEGSEEDAALERWQALDALNEEAADEGA